MSSGAVHLMTQVAVSLGEFLTAAHVGSRACRRARRAAGAGGRTGTRAGTRGGVVGPCRGRASRR